MIYTTNYNFGLYENTDIFDVEKTNENFETIDKVLGGMSFEICTEEEYSSLNIPDEKTLYFVKNGKKIEMYLGAVKLLSGESSAPKTTTIYTAKPTIESYVTTVTKEDL